jgi:hypothetical protein
MFARYLRRQPQRTVVRHAIVAAHGRIRISQVCPCRTRGFKRRQEFLRRHGAKLLAKFADLFGSTEVEDQGGPDHRQRRLEIRWSLLPDVWPIDRHLGRGSIAGNDDGRGGVSKPAACSSASIE